MARAMTGQRHMALQRAARAGANSSARTNASGPLRKVVRETTAPLPGNPDIQVPRLLLECGHLVRYPRGPFGVDDRIAAARRRCDQCGAADRQARVLVDDTGKPYLCDYWLPAKRKCEDPATVNAADRWGAPLRFCDPHWALQAHVQAQYGPGVAVAP